MTALADERMARTILYGRRTGTVRVLPRLARLSRLLDELLTLQAVAGRYHCRCGDPGDCNEPRAVHP